MKITFLRLSLINDLINDLINYLLTYRQNKGNETATSV